MSERRLPRFSDVVGKEEAARLAAEEREAQQRIQRRRMEMIAARSPEYQRMRAERDRLAAQIQRVRALCDSCDIRIDGVPTRKVPVAAVRAALDDNGGTP